MPCYRPLKGYRAQRVNAGTGKRSIVFNVREGFRDLPVTLPCGRCIGCKLEKSRQWAIRCAHEAELNGINNCFITLTYAPRHLPKNGTLVLKHFQDFMKRFRWEYGNGIRFFHCGEYGEKLGRPHYHACIFGFRFDDLQFLKEERGHKYFISKKLKRLWKYGFHVIGDGVNWEMAAYVARYITKKITGPGAEAHYKGKKPEYTTMSRRPGIGKNWFKMYKTDVFPSDQVVLRDRVLKPPKYYDRQYEIDEPEMWKRVKRKRQRIAKERQIGDERLDVMERCKIEKSKRLKRDYEDGTQG